MNCETISLDQNLIEQPIAILKQGRYVLQSCLSQGVFDSSYRAIDTESNQLVFLKMLMLVLEDKQEKQQWHNQCLNLVQHLSQCQSPYFAAVKDSFIVEDKIYIVSEYIQAQTLAQLLENANKLPLVQALKYIKQVSFALKALHELGLVHQNLKPQNIMIAQNRATLTDFGFICQLNPQMRSTHSSLLGSGYAAIEQYQPHGICNAATDIYGLAATLYHLITGRPPLPAPLRAEIPSLDWHNFGSDLSRKLKQVLLQSLAMSNSDRPQSVDQWLTLLDAVTSPQKTQLGAIVATKAEVKIKEIKLPPFAKKPSLILPQLEPELAQSSTVTTVTPVIKKRKVKVQTTAVKSESKLGLFKFLLLTSAVTMSAGIGFGLAVRHNLPQQAGSSILHQEQSFPPRQDWPISELKE